MSATESCELETASTLMLNAASICRRLGRQYFEADDASNPAQCRLLWTVHKLEHAISLRTEREPSLVLNAKISCDAQAYRLNKLAILHARVRTEERKCLSSDGKDCPSLLEDLRELSHETRKSLVSPTAQHVYHPVL